MGARSTALTRGEKEGTRKKVGRERFKETRSGESECEGAEAIGKGPKKEVGEQVSAPECRSVGAAGRAFFPSSGVFVRLILRLHLLWEFCER